LKIASLGDAADHSGIHLFLGRVGFEVLPLADAVRQRWLDEGSSGL
jgi:hypothetical protein